MTERTTFTSEEARRVGQEIGIDWTSAPLDLEQFRMGMDVELEHGLQDPLTDVSHDDSVMTGEIALAHLNEFPDYYTRLARMEEEAKPIFRAEEPVGCHAARLVVSAGSRRV